MVKIFVGNLNPESKAADLRKKFEAYGKVTECDVVNNYAFVHMEKDADADAAISALHNATLDGVKINVERSHGKRGGPGGPMRRRSEGRYRDYPDRFRGPIPPRYMGPGPTPPRMGRYGPGWDDGYGSPYGPPRSGARGSYDYPSNGTSGRYPPERGEPMRAPRAGPRDGPPGAGYRGPGAEAAPPTRDYPSKAAPPRPSRYDSYDGYGDYDRYREPGPPSGAPRSEEYYDNYGSYSSGGNYDDYRSGERSGGGAYDSGYDYGYYDYGPGSRSPVSASRSGRPPMRNFSPERNASSYL